VLVPFTITLRDGGRMVCLRRLRRLAGASMGFIAHFRDHSGRELGLSKNTVADIVKRARIRPT
jgi:hypothetical protein